MSRRSVVKRAKLRRSRRMYFQARLIASLVLADPVLQTHPNLQDAVRRMQRMVYQAHATLRLVGRILRPAYVPLRRHLARVEQQRRLSMGKYRCVVKRATLHHR